MENQRKRKIFAALAVLFASLSLMGCGSEPSPNVAQKYTYRATGTSPYCDTGTHEFTSFDAMCAGLRDDAANAYQCRGGRQQLFSDYHCTGYF